MRAGDFREGDIDGVVLRQLTRHSDNRGWLMELFRHDWLTGDLHPAMSYISMTRPGVARGPHEHRDQTDLFVFAGPSTFRLYLWDARVGSSTRMNRMVMDVGGDSPVYVTVPPGVVHAYKNISDSEGLVINFPNRLYRGKDYSEQVDEVRYEDDPDSPFRLEP